MRSNSSVPPPASRSDSAIFPRSSSLVKIPRAGGQVPTQIVAPAWARALEMAKPKPLSSATPAMKARFPARSMFSMGPKLPAYGRARPGEPGAERSENQEITSPQSPFGERFVERDRDGGGSRVAVLLDIGVDLLVAEAERFLHHLGDSLVRLMGDQERDIGGRTAVGPQRQLDGLRHQHGSGLEHFAPVHHRPVLAGLEHR